MSRLVVQLLVVLCCLCHATLAQTFHYSHGWTNGKRSNLPSQIFSPRGQQHRADVANLENNEEAESPVALGSLYHPRLGLLRPLESSGSAPLVLVPAKGMHGRNLYRAFRADLSSSPFEVSESD